MPNKSLQQEIWQNKLETKMHYPKMDYNRGDKN
jgi:hypothetical protein